MCSVLSLNASEAEGNTRHVSLLHAYGVPVGAEVLVGFDLITAQWWRSAVLGDRVGGDAA